MDATLMEFQGTPAAKRKLQARVTAAWEVLMPGGLCRFCGHGGASHFATTIALPQLNGLGFGEPEICTAFCKACAQERGASQVTCYIRPTR